MARSIWQRARSSGTFCLVLPYSTGRTPIFRHRLSRPAVLYGYAFNHASAIVTKLNGLRKIRPKSEHTSFSHSPMHPQLARRPAVSGRHPLCLASPDSGRVPRPRPAYLVQFVLRPIASRNARASLRRAQPAFLVQPHSAGRQDLPHSALRRMGPRTRDCTPHIGIAPEPVGRFRLRSEWPFLPQAPEPPSPWLKRAPSET